MDSRVGSQMKEYVVVQRYTGKIMLAWSCGVNIATEKYWWTCLDLDGKENKVS